MFNANFKLVKERSTRTLSEILNQSAFVALKIRQEAGQNALCLSIEDTHAFFVAFLASLSLENEVYIISQANSEVQGFSLTDSLILAWLEEFESTGQSQDSGASENLSKNLNCAQEILNLNPQKSFFIQTSGSSGASKNIQKYLQQMLDEARFLKAEFNISAQDLFLSSVSHSHLWGLTCKIFLPLMAGASLEEQTLIYPDFILQYARQHASENVNLHASQKTSQNTQENADKKARKSLILISSPTLLNSFSLQNDFDALALFRLVFSAGGKLSAHNKALLAGKCTIVEIYGSSETGVIAQSIGQHFRAFSGVKLELDSEQRLKISSPWTQGAFQSNDCARLINAREFELLGRFDRIIKLYEKRVSLDFLEKTLKEHDFIEDARTGLKDEDNRISALIVLSSTGKQAFRKGGKKAIISALKEYLKKDFASFVRYFYIKEALPYNALGKITKASFLKALNENITPKLEITEQSAHALKAKAYISEACFYFNGHFTNFALVPGFIELGFIYELSKCFGVRVSDIILIENAKFSGFIQPFDEIELEITLKNSRLYFEIALHGKPCASGKMLLKEDFWARFSPVLSTFDADLAQSAQTKGAP